MQYIIIRAFVITLSYNPKEIAKVIGRIGGGNCIGITRDGLYDFPPLVL